MFSDIGKGNRTILDGVVASVTAPSLWSFVIVGAGSFVLLNSIVTLGNGSWNLTLTIFWLLPIAETIVATFGALKSRKMITRCHAPPVVYQGSLIVVLPTVGR